MLPNATRVAKAAIAATMATLARRAINMAASGAHFANSFIASSASTPPVMEIGAYVALAARSALEIMIWSILVASWSTDAANTRRPNPHHRIAPMHIAHGSPEV